MGGGVLPGLASCWSSPLLHPSPLILSLPLQVVFSLASGNIAGAFEIITTNDSIGEVFVATPLDREELDHYILKVSANCLPSQESSAHQHALAFSFLLSPSAVGRQNPLGPRA